MRMSMLLRSFTGLVSQQSDFHLRAGDQTAVGSGMLGRDKFLWNIFKLIDGHNNLIKCCYLCRAVRQYCTYSRRVFSAPLNAKIEWRSLCLIPPQHSRRPLKRALGRHKGSQCGSSTSPKISERLALNLSAVIMWTLSKNSALIASKRMHGANHRSKELGV